jgi:predicted  nucleic acid-binding Zn-ribbon protein
MSTEANTTQTQNNGSKITPSAPANQPVKPDPMSILDFVKEQMESKKAEAQPKQEVKKEVPKQKVKSTKPVETKTEVKTEVKTEAKKDETKTGDDDLKLSKFSQSLLNEEEKKADDTKTEGKPEDKKEGSTEEGDDDIKLPETASVAAKDAFKKVNSERSRLKRELVALKEEKTKLEEQVKTVNTEETSKRIAELETELETFKKYNEEAETKLYALDVQQSARYKETISEPLQSIANEVESIASKYTLDAGKLRRAMAAEDTNGLSDILSEAEVNDFDKVQLAKLRTDVKSILKTRLILEKDSKAAAEILKKAEEEETKQFMSAKKTEYTKSLTKHKESITGVMPFLFTKSEDDNEWNGLVEEYDKFLTTADPTQFTAEKTAQAMAMAGATPILFAAIDRLMSDNKVLIDKYKKLTKSNPAAGPSTATAPNSAPKTEGTISDFVRGELSKRGR